MVERPRNGNFLVVRRPATFGAKGLVSRHRRWHHARVKYLIILALACAGVACAVYAGNQHDERLWRAYTRIRPGMAPAQATAILGEPSWSGPCGARFPYDYAKKLRRRVWISLRVCPTEPAILGCSDRREKSCHRNRLDRESIA